MKINQLINQSPMPIFNNVYLLKRSLFIKNVLPLSLWDLSHQALESTVYCGIGVIFIGGPDWHPVELCSVVCNQYARRI